MLKNRYQEVLIGLNIVSLVRGIISLRRKRTTLLIDDERFRAQSYPQNFLSEFEVLALLRLGKVHDIPELVDLRQFLSSGTMEFVTDNFRLQTGKSPLANLKELLRKFPGLIDASDLDLVYQESEENFDRYFIEELARFESLSFEASLRPKGVRFDLQGPKWLRTVFTRFGDVLNREYALSQDLTAPSLLHLMSVAFEEKMKTKMAPEEVPYYFFKLLSPVYRLQDFFLTTQLKRRLTLMGGDTKESPVQYWQLHEKKFENLLLASFEGVISGDRVLFFSHLPQEVPFTVNSPWPLMRKTLVSPQKRTASPFPATSLTFMTEAGSLGSEEPYRVLITEGGEMVHYEWPYPELPGSKADFYKEGTLRSFEKDSVFLPFEKKDWQFGGLQSVTLDMRSMREARKTEAAVLTRLPLQITLNDSIIEGFEYWGPFRYKSFGLLALAYGIEGL
ncbi:MAG: hypothetical protein ACJ76H_16690 [Bacteriovoracaceae bacterium]